MQPNASALEPYDPGFSPCRVNLSANENDYGLPAPVEDEMRLALSRTPTNRYPDPLSGELCGIIASWHGVAPEQVYVSNGGDEALFNLFLAFGGAGRTLLDCPPTFSVYALYASMLGTTVRSVPRDPSTFAPDADALLAAAPECDLAILTSPNNPTGDLVDLDLVSRLCDEVPGIVLVDEAYGEFAPDGASAASLMAVHDNLAILHTFSKAFSLAGARCGYVLADPGVVAALAAVRQPYSVNVLTQAVAQVVARRHDDFLPQLSEIRRERGRLLESLQELGRTLPIQTWPSEGNFLLVRVPHASQVRERLRDDYSILVRDFSATPSLNDCLRVTVGTPREDDLLLDALVTLVKEEQ
jgi:histidinol-phosphate aminotransferase